jgi:hypothetical protein
MCPRCGYYNGAHAPTCPAYVSPANKIGGVIALIFFIMVLIGAVIAIAMAISTYA